MRLRERKADKNQETSIIFTNKTRRIGINRHKNKNSPNQSASVPGRSILTNISSVRDIIQLANDKNLPAALISIDQSKAFDRVNWDFLFKTFNEVWLRRQIYEYN